ncbi:tripartite tricarboxylate transporter substrate-binding protein [Paracraurococcus lichenis]|uniref:Tripartite tricarboxylate transporter substrate-binding protein n=1 Tax=Paracraurococcus lichenis TaxID=3064888 RepID=A0ABT9DU40_9PROT|nr:tripartite tricarboxylate transporter substrate-binding protein [Paracraurococcus sp. LOR1-02]MDO9707416.1 tripartite tricarboxylate transporter substrate-binding protein [Paracraurococcus sp. LOR1-02]
MTMLTRRAALAGLGALALTAPALAQAPRTIRALLGWPPGGSSDIVARTFAERMRGTLNANVLVENRPGAGGRIALEGMKGAPADGSLYIQTPASMLVIYPHLYRSLRYDPLADFTPVSTVCAFPFAFTVRADHPAKTLAEFIAWAKGRQQTDWASPSPGTMPHFLGVEFARQAGIALNHVPYRGGAPVMTDVLAGVITAGMNVLSEPVPFHLAGQMRILAVSAPRRVPRLPEVPTFAELGFPDLSRQEWFGVLLPAGAAPGVVQPLHAALAAAARTTEVQEVLTKLEFAPEIMEPAAFAARIRAERESWGPIVAASGFKPEE